MADGADQRLGQAAIQGQLAQQASRALGAFVPGAAVQCGPGIRPQLVQMGIKCRAEPLGGWQLVGGVAEVCAQLPKCLAPEAGGAAQARDGFGAVFHADEIITSLRSDEICFQGMEHTRTLTYGEAENFIDSGIALLHPECIPLARTVGMAIVLIKTPEDTLRISSEKTGTKVKAAVSRRGVVFVKLRSLGILTSYLFIGKVFDVFEKYKVPVYLATSSNVSVSLAVKCSNDTLRLIYRELHKYAEIGMETEMSVVSVIGDLNWEKHTGLEARIIETLKEMPVCMISYGSSTHNLSVLVREQDREKALMTLCKAFLDIPSEKFDVIKQTQLQDSFVM